MTQTRWWSSRIASLCRLACIAIGLLSISGCPTEPAYEDAGDTPYDPIPCPDEVPELSIGLTVGGHNGVLRAELRDADHIPAEVFLNRWEVQLQKPDGTLVTDATLSALAWMPTHKHNGIKPIRIEALEDGRFDVADINMWMSGPWEVQLTVDSESEGADYIVFDVCIE